VAACGLACSTAAYDGGLEVYTLNITHMHTHTHWCIGQVNMA